MTKRVFGHAMLLFIAVTNLFLSYQGLKDKSGVDKIIVKKQPYQLLNTNLELFPSFDASNFHKLVIESLKVGQNIVSILYLCECAKAR